MRGHSSHRGPVYTVLVHLIAFSPHPATGLGSRWWLQARRRRRSGGTGAAPAERYVFRALRDRVVVGRTKIRMPPEPYGSLETDVTEPCSP